MANRTMYVGDTFPEINLQVSDETGVLDLSAADAITVKFIGKSFEFSGDGTPITPPTEDPNGINHWNLSYTFASGDTSNVDEYQPFAVVTWSDGEVQTFPTSDVLNVIALPTA